MSQFEEDYFLENTSFIVKCVYTFRSGKKSLKDTLKSIYF